MWCIAFILWLLGIYVINVIIRHGPKACDCLSCISSCSLIILKITEAILYVAVAVR